MSEPSPAISAEERKGLMACGLCRLEIDALEAIAVAAYRTLRLPDLHPNERREATTLLRRLQNDILARPGARALGWLRD